MTEGRDEPGDDEPPRSVGQEPGSAAQPTEPAAGLTEGAEPSADEAPSEATSEPPTIGWATGVQWEPIDPGRNVPVPGAVNFKVGPVFARTLDTFLRRPFFFLLLAVPGALVGLVGPSANGQPSSVWPTVIFFVLESVVTVPFAVAMIIATDDLRADREVSFRSVIERALGRTVPALISELVTSVALAGVVFLPAILGAQSLGAGGGAFVLIIVFVVLVYVGIRLLLSQPAIALDQLGPIQGLTRSWAVTKGSMWKLVGLSIAIGLLTLPLTIGAGILSSNSNETLSAGVAAITTFIAAPLTSIAFAIAYGDLTGRAASVRLLGPGSRNRRLLVAGILGLGVVVCLLAIPRTRSASVEGPVAKVSVDVGGTIR